MTSLCTWADEIKRVMAVYSTYSSQYNLCGRMASIQVKNNGHGAYGFVCEEHNAALVQRILSSAYDGDVPFSLIEIE